MSEQDKNYMSVFVPYVGDYVRNDLRDIMDKLNIGTISRIDIATKRNQPSNMAFIHFREWNDENPFTNEVKYFMETEGEWRIPDKYIVKDRDFTLYLKINTNPVPSETMSIETLSDALTRTVDMTELLQKECNKLCAIVMVHNETFASMMSRVFECERENEILRSKLEDSEYNGQILALRLDTLEDYVYNWQEREMRHQYVNMEATATIPKTRLERQTNGGGYIHENLKPYDFWSKCELGEQEQEQEYEHDRIYSEYEYIENPYTEDDEEPSGNDSSFDPRIYGDYTA